jgi:hypothetical protein
MVVLLDLETYIRAAIPRAKQVNGHVLWRNKPVVVRCADAVANCEPARLRPNLSEAARQDTRTSQDLTRPGPGSRAARAGLRPEADRLTAYSGSIKKR